MIELDISNTGSVTMSGKRNRRTKIKLCVGDTIRLTASDGRSAIVTACKSSTAACSHCIFSVFSEDSYAKDVVGYHCPHPFKSIFALCYKIDPSEPGSGYFTTMEDLI